MNRTPLRAGMSIATASLLALGPAAAAAPVAFTVPTYLTAGTGPWLVATGDLNRDGRPDVGVANIGAVGGNAVTLLLNATTTAGSAAALHPVKRLSGASAQSVAFADLDGDRIADVVATDQPLSPAGRLRIWRNLTLRGALTLTLSSPLALRIGSTPEIVVAADMDRDGRRDLVVANFGSLGSRAVTVFRNTSPAPGTISFGPAQHFTGGAGAEGMTVADLNADGHPEVITGNTVGNTIAILRNNSTRGDIALATPQKVPVNLGPTAVAAADLNGDHSPDLAVGSSFSGPRSLATLVNQTPDGASAFSFGIETDYASDQGAEGITLVDLDGDGRRDIVLACYAQRLAIDSGGFTIFRNQTKAGDTALSLEPAQRVPIGPATVAVAADDINRDGRPDLIGANSMAPPSRGVAVVLNQTG